MIFCERGGKVGHPGKFFLFLFPSQRGAVVIEVGGMCGFMWPIAVWEVWLLVAVGLLALSEMPFLPTHTLTPCKSRQCFLTAHNEIYLQGSLFTRLWSTSLYQQGSHSQYQRWCIYIPVQRKGMWHLWQTVTEFTWSSKIFTMYKPQYFPTI